MAGVNGVITLWQLVWLLATVGAGAGGVLLASNSDFKKSWVTAQNQAFVRLPSSSHVAEAS